MGVERGWRPLSKKTFCTFWSQNLASPGKKSAKLSDNLVKFDKRNTLITFKLTVPRGNNVFLISHLRRWLGTNLLRRFSNSRPKKTTNNPEQTRPVDNRLVYESKCYKNNHPDSDPSDPIHGMTRSQQTIIFRLRTGHNRLRKHMYKRFKVGDSEICPCGQAPQNTEHVLQTCSSHRQLRARTWPNHIPLEKKLYGTTEELALTVDYIVASGLTVWRTAAGRTKKKISHFQVRQPRKNADKETRS